MRLPQPLYPLTIAALFAVAACALAACAAATRQPFVTMHGNGRVTLVPSPSMAYSGTIDHEEQFADGSRASAGILDDGIGTFTFVERRGSRYMTVTLPGKAIEVFQTGRSRPRVREIIPTEADLTCGVGHPEPQPMISALVSCGDLHCDAARAAVEADATVPANLCANPMGAGPAAEAVIEVLPAYTDDAETGAGGPEAARSMIVAAFAQTNAAFRRSRINARIAYAACGGVPCITKVVYTEEAGFWHYMIKDLENLFGGSSGLGVLHTLRESCRADVVMLITENNKAMNSGRACVMQQPSRAFAPFAFAVVKRTAIPTSYAFAHELGHIMGAGHRDADDGCDITLCSYSFAANFTRGGSTYETLMGNDSTTPNFLVFSDPAYFSMPNTTNNAATIRLTAPIVASFKP